MRLPLPQRAADFGFVGCAPPKALRDDNAVFGWDSLRRPFAGMPHLGEM